MSEAKQIYSASLLNPANDNKRHRATNEEMEARATFLIAYAAEHEPVTVRQLFYAATVAGVPGIAKNEDGYNAIQQQVLKLRRQGRMPYGHIADLTRFMRKPTTSNSIYDALDDTARLYRKALWRDQPIHVEIWCEKDALAGCISPITHYFDVPLMVCRGFASETFAHQAVESWAEMRDKEVHVYHLGDFDRSGRDACDDLRSKLERFAKKKGVRVYFENMALTEYQIAAWNLPTREPKRNTPADRRWPHDFACELDALPPGQLRNLVYWQLDQYLPEQDMKVLRAAEESERSLLRMFAQTARPKDESGT
jgi:hypothetical protein